MVGFGGWQQWRGELLVELEEKFHAGTVAGEGFLAVATVHGAVEFGVGSCQRWRHGDGIVEVGQRALFGGVRLRRTLIDS